MGSSLILNNGELLEYYAKFNSIEYKYGEYVDEFITSPLEKIKCMQRLTDYERARNFSELTKKNMNSTVLNLENIYGKRDIAENIAIIYHLVYMKVIGEYINIDGVERLFSDKYANYEWELHLGMDFDSHEMDYYRDHFIHQVKDAFTMDRLLANGYLGAVRNVLKNESNSKISAFVKKYVDIQYEKDNYFAEFIDNKEFTGERQKDFYTDTIIKMSSYIAGLFHDIGYPIVNNMKGNKNIMEYIFETYNLNDYTINFNKITALLGNSLLFRVEPIKRIKKRLEGNEAVKQKIDHGVVSAIVFLLHFYENGAIHRLEPYKICAVELAGLAIYNHNNSYSYIKGKKADYERSIFFQNPISHLLRISDDMQEWGRIYFQLTDKSNLIICDKCKTPIIKINKNVKQEKETEEYWCNCCEGDNINFKRIFPEAGFSYRRIYKVTICDEVKIEWKEDLKEEHIYLDYDLNRLLHIAYISPSYARYRGKEIGKLKRLFLHQAVPYKTYVHTFMSANIIAIKSEIAGTKLLKKKLEGEKEDLVEKLKKFEIEDCLEICNNLKESSDEYKMILEMIGDIENKETGNYLKDSLNRYMKLYVYMCCFSLYNEFSLKEEREEGVKRLEKYLFEQAIYTKQSDKNVKSLIHNYIKYAKRRFFNLQDYPYYPERYFEQFKYKDSLDITISEFCKADSYKENGLNIGEFNAYSDLYLFQILDKIIVE